MNKRLAITLLIALLLAVGTVGAIRFAKGYRLDLKKKQVTATGLLVANSFPKGASVFINDKLTTATDDTLNLPPGNYQIKIVKDGFIPWEKELQLEKELVTQTNARLFPTVPDLKGLTFAGALNPTPSPDGQKIAFVVASASAQLKNGLWVLNLADSPLSLSRDAYQVGRNTTVFDFTQASLFWAPDSKQILAKTEDNTFLLAADRLNPSADLKDATAELPLIIERWQEELALKRTRQLEKLPLEIAQIATRSAKNIYFSPDEEKLLYTATVSAVIAEELVPSLPASNTQPEEREIKTGRIYVYDLKEDKNFFIAEAGKETESEFDSTKKSAAKEKGFDWHQALTKLQNQYSPLSAEAIQWFPTSSHLILTEADKITILEYDGTNRAVVYAGPFAESFVYPWPDGSKLIIATSLNPESSLSPNLYAIDLK